MEIMLVENPRLYFFIPQKRWLCSCCLLIHKGANILVHILPLMVIKSDRCLHELMLDKLMLEKHVTHSVGSEVRPICTC